MLGRSGTRLWSRKQIAQILEKGRAFDEFGNVIEGHHINTVKGNPIEQASNPDNIRSMTREEHQELHRINGGTRVPISGEPTVNRTAMVAEAEAEAAAALAAEQRAVMYRQAVIDDETEIMVDH
ncbi:hypothetical protein GCM10009087_04980 [Sphingomonas oligophenolica]